MIRTQIYLPQSQITKLRTAARQRRTTVSDIVRELIDINNINHLERKKNTRQKKVMSGLSATAEKIAKMGFKGPADLAKNMDKYYYGNI